MLLHTALLQSCRHSLLLLPVQLHIMLRLHTAGTPAPNCGRSCNKDIAAVLNTHKTPILSRPFSIITGSRSLSS
jgi:hypothetical protein